MCSSLRPGYRYLYLAGRAGRPDSGIQSTCAKGEIEEAASWEQTADKVACVRGAMPERGLNRLADLGDRHVIWTFCNSCDRSTSLSTPRLIAVYGPTFATEELKRRLTC